MITANLLSRLYSRPLRLMEPWVPHIRDGLELANCRSDKEIAHWLSQIGHESGGLQYTSELWGPTPQQMRYTRDFGKHWGPYDRRRHALTYPNKLAFDLGNVHRADGSHFRGHGLLQVTGRTNFKLAETRLNKLLGGAEVPLGSLMVNPKLLGGRRLAALSASDYWIRRNLNQFSENTNVASLTKVINGGYNGLSHRQLLFNRFFLINKG